jgi:hypothetical protein
MRAVTALSLIASVLICCPASATQIPVQRPTHVAPEHPFVRLAEHEHDGGGEHENEPPEVETPDQQETEKPETPETEQHDSSDQSDSSEHETPETPETGQHDSSDQSDASDHEVPETPDPVNTSTTTEPTTTGETTTEASTAAIEIEEDSIGGEHTADDVLALAGPDEVAAIRQAGLTVDIETPLSAGRSLIVIRTSQDGAATETLAAVRKIVPSVTADFDSVYRLSGTQHVVVPMPQNIAAVDPTSSVVGMVDTAIASNPVATKSLVSMERSFVNGLPPADRSHGTAIALISGQHGVRVVSTNVFFGDKQKRLATTTAIVVRAIDWLVTKGVRVINLSFAGPPNLLLQDEIRRAQATGCIFVAAAGNAGPAAPPAYPAADAGVIAVTAVDQHDRPYLYANQGAYIAFAALGVDVVVSGDAPTHKLSGTSFAAPIIAAELSKQMSETGDSARAVRALQQRAIDLGAPGKDPVFGWGIIR